MFKEIIKYSFVIIFFPLLVFLIGGCGNTSQNLNTVQTKNGIQEANPLIMSQYELIETPKYQQLKKEIEKARNDVNKLKSEKAVLLTKYTEEYNPVKKISKNLEEAKKNLHRLEDLLDEEFNKLESRPKNIPV